MWERLEVESYGVWRCFQYPPRFESYLWPRQAGISAKLFEKTIVEFLVSQYRERTDGIGRLKKHYPKRTVESMWKRKIYWRGSFKFKTWTA